MVQGLYARMELHDFTRTVGDLSIGVAMLNAMGHLTYFNDAAVRAFGAKSRREAVGQRFGPARPHDNLIKQDGTPLAPAECPVCVPLVSAKELAGVVGRVDSDRVAWYYVAGKPRTDAPGALVTFHAIKE